MLDDKVSICGPAFLDCGAHSVHTGKWEKLPIDDYINFVNKHHACFSLIASPDVVGNTLETTKNFKYFIERVTFPRDKILSVYHLQARAINQFDYILDYSLEAGLSWIAVGGALGVGFSPVQKMVALEQVYKKMQARGSPFKVHLFGIHDPTSVKLFHPQSVDSATFIQKARVLHYHEYDFHGWKMKPRERQLGRRMPRDQMTEEAVKRLMRHKELLLRLDPETADINYITRQVEKAPDAVKVLAVNGLNVVEFELHVRATLGYNFVHYITCPTSYVTGYTGLYKAIFQHVWKKRSLVSFPQFWELSYPQLEKELKLFGPLGSSGDADEN